MKQLIQNWYTVTLKKVQILPLKTNTKSTQVYLMKLFRTNNIETVEFCQDQFGFDKPSVLWARRVRNFDVCHACSTVSSLRRKIPFVS